MSEEDDGVKEDVVHRDLVRIVCRWRAYQKSDPHANPFFFLAEIVRTGMLPRVPKPRKLA